MLRRGGARRSGYTLVEMLVSLSVSAVVIGLAGGIGFRQQRFHRDVVVAVERIEQLEQAVALLPITLRSISAADGDIPPGGARDTSLEFRATIATAVVCDAGQSTVVLAPTNTDAPHLASVLSRPEVNDSLWILDADSSDSWSPRAITAVVDTLAICRIGTAPLWDGAARSAIAVRVASAMGAVSGSPIRITRTWRYSLYRASDGAWYLGAKEWNAATSRFNTIQPVGGPFLSAAAGGITFRYSDSTGGAISSGAFLTRSIAVIDVGFRVDSIIPGKSAHPLSIHGAATASIGLRNRAR